MNKSKNANELRFIQLSGPVRVNITIDFYRSTYDDFEVSSNLASTMDQDKLSKCKRLFDSNIEDRSNEIE